MKKWGRVVVGTLVSLWLEHVGRLCSELGGEENPAARAGKSFSLRSSLRSLVLSVASAAEVRAETTESRSVASPCLVAPPLGVTLFY